MFRSLPDELQLVCAAHLDISSAGRFAQASRACERSVLAWLTAAKADHEAAQQAKARAAAAAAGKQRLFSPAGRAFLDVYVSSFILNFHEPVARKQLVQDILLAAASREEELGSSSWTVAAVTARLKKVARVRATM